MVVNVQEPNALVSVHIAEDRVPARFSPVLFDSATGISQNLRSSPVFRFRSGAAPGSRRSFDVLLGDSTLPAVTVSSPNGGESVIAGFPTTVRFRSADSTGVLRHHVYFLTAPSATPFLIDSTGGADTAVVWTPSVATTTGRIVVVALDSVLNEGADTSDASFTVLAGDSVSRVLNPQWNFLSVPLLQTDMSPAGIFQDDLGSAPTMYGFRPSLNSYFFPDTLTLGQGYWLLAGPSGGTVDAVGAPQSLVHRSLEQGWNIIGNPFPLPFLRTALRFTDGLTVKTVGEAADAGWVRDLLYGFNGASYVIELSSLGVWNAYWLEVLLGGISVRYDIGLNSSPAGPAPAPPASSR
jgi:hypothetical protein